MVLPLLFVLGGQAPDKSPIELKSRIVEASLFKSGLVMLKREVMIPQGSGKYRLDVLPSALDGTFWYDSPDNLSLSDISTVLRISDAKKQISASSLLEILSLNVGKKVTLVERSISTTPSTKTTGTILKVTPGSILMKLDNGNFYSPNVSVVSEVQGKDLKASSDQTVKKADLRIQFSAKADAPARLQFIDLEAGAAWTSSYLIKLGADHKADVQGKAQIAVGGLTFHDTRVTAMAGQPNLPTTGRFDLAAGYGSLMAYLSDSQDRYRSYHDDAVDPYTILPSLNVQYQNPFSQSPYFGGGFGGGGMGGAAGGMGFPGGPQNRMEEANDLKNLPQDARSERVEGLYSYPMGVMNLEPGDRVTRLLFSQKADYETLYKWQADNGNTTVQNTLRITNNSKIPWTGGPALILRDEQPLAQLPMPFTGLKGVADLNLGTAEDVSVHREDKQTRIEPDIIPVLGYQTRKSVEETHLIVENARDDYATVVVTMTVAGEVTDADGATVTQLAAREDIFNWRRKVEWKIMLTPHERRELVLGHTRLFSVAN